MDASARCRYFGSAACCGDPSSGCAGPKVTVSSVGTFVRRQARGGDPLSDQIRAVTQRLRAAAPGWAQRDVEERIDVLARWGREFTARRDEFVAALAADTGRLALSELEVDWVLGAIDRQ